MDYGIILTAASDGILYNRIEGQLLSIGFSVQLASDSSETLSCLRSAAGRLHAVILYFGGADGGDIQLLRDIRSADKSIPIIVVSERAATADVVHAIKSGATDFLSMPVEADDLAHALKRLPEPAERDSRDSATFGDHGLPEFFAGSNPRMRQIHAQAGQIGRSGVPVLIQGETGCGKEVLARSIHNQSPRAGQVFLKLNCAALPSELVESELFGYERGAFTGALRRKPGMFELADGGTLMLDEIGDMDVRLQAKLLQVLQDQEFRRVGGTETVRVNVRLIAATHRDLERAIHDGTFREDLYYRINVVNVRVPPLRDRKEDLLAIAQFLLKKYAGTDIPPEMAVVPRINSDLKHVMLSYDWPGNVRELENCMRRLLIFGDSSVVAAEIRARCDVQRPIRIRTGDAERFGEPGLEISILEQATREKERADAATILATLTATRWNRKHAAKMLNIDYKSLLYRMKKLGVHKIGTSDSPQVISKRAANGD
jgi:two-component system response regulator AtoC